MSTPLTRREFVQAALGATAALGGAAALGGVAGCASARPAEKKTVATPSSSYGPSEAAERGILVGYATATGSTVDVANAIGAVLGERGLAADVKPLAEQPALMRYRAAVLGSAIHGGKWLPEATAYVEQNRVALAAMPVALFCVHAMNCGPDPEATQRRQAYLDPQRALLRPIAEGYFVGIGPTGAESNWLTLSAFKAFGGCVEGDGRDFDAIRAWAQQLAL